MLTKEELDNAPEGIKYKDAMQLDGLYYTMAVSVLDCTGCGSCANVCPVNNAGKKDPALAMKPLETQLNEQANYDYAADLGEKQAVLDEKTEIYNTAEKEYQQAFEQNQNTYSS